MAKISTFIAALIFTSQSILAQIPNADFELLDSTQTALQNWFNTQVFIYGLNDSILSDGPLYGKSTNSYSGNYALELRNMYNVSSGTAYNGGVSCNVLDTNLYQSFATHFTISTKPYNLSFYYLYDQNPANDSTQCVVQILNSSKAIIGSGKITLWEMHGAYQAAFVPISYNTTLADSTPAFARISFANKLNQAAGIHVGERILIDELRFDATPTPLASIDANAGLQFYPNPATHTLHVQSSRAAASDDLSIFNMQGQCVHHAKFSDQIDISSLPQGLYVLRCNATVLKFMKQ